MGRTFNCGGIEMDAKELMIGDYVRLVADGDNEILQVSYIRKDGVIFEKYAVFF